MIKIYSKQDFEHMRIAGEAAANTLDFITDYITEGISTYDLDKLVAEHTKKQGGICAPLNYNGFPKHCCISINDVICHGIPNKKEFLKDGDILNIDVTTIINGYHGDTSRMYIVGNASDKAKELVDITYDAMMKAISICKPGIPLSKIGIVIEELCEPKGFSIVRDFCGHGTGKVFHDEPNVLHYYEKQNEKILLQEGMIFTIEPMINTGTHELYIEDNDWVARTADGSLSAQFEHTLGITKNGVEIFTKSPKGFTKPPYKK